MKKIFLAAVLVVSAGVVEANNFNLPPQIQVGVHGRHGSINVRVGGFGFDGVGVGVPVQRCYEHVMVEPPMVYYDNFGRRIVRSATYNRVRVC